DRRPRRGSCRGRRHARGPDGLLRGLSPDRALAAVTAGGGPVSWHGAPRQPAKPSDFAGTSRRVLRRLLQDRLRIGALALFGLVGVTLSVVGPRILGHATDLVFDGFVSGLFPAGMSKDEAVRSLRDGGDAQLAELVASLEDRKSTRLNSSHVKISYAVFCLK